MRRIAPLGHRTCSLAQNHRPTFRHRLPGASANASKSTPLSLVVHLKDRNACVPSTKLTQCPRRNDEQPVDTVPSMRSVDPACCSVPNFFRGRVALKVRHAVILQHFPARGRVCLPRDFGRRVRPRNSKARTNAYDRDFSSTPRPCDRKA